MPSMRTRVKPALRTCSRTSRCSPLRSFTSGASSRNFVPSGRSAISWTICCDDCCDTDPPRPLGIERVEGEARLARARDAGDDDQLLLRNLDGDVLEVVLARPCNDD